MGNPRWASKPPVQRHENAKSEHVRTLMRTYSRPEKFPDVRPLKVGIECGLFVRVGPLYHADKTTSWHLWDRMESGTFFHEFDLENGHRVCFHASMLDAAVKVMLDWGRFVIVA